MTILSNEFVHVAVCIDQLVICLFVCMYLDLVILLHDFKTFVISMCSNSDCDAGIA